MKKHFRSFRALFVPAFLLVSVSAVVEAAQQQSLRRPGSQPGPILPPGPTARCRRAGDAVTIAEDKDVVLDVSPPALRSLTIDGKLSFANNAISS